MADYTTIDMVVRSLLDDILRTDVPPAGTQAWGFFDDNGALVSVPLADLSSPAATAPTYTAGAGIDISPTNVISATPAPHAVVAVVAGEEKGFNTLADAIAANPSVIYQYGDLELTSATSRFAGTLFGRGHTLTIAAGGQLRLVRNAILSNCAMPAAGGSVEIVGAGVPGGSTVPAPSDCVQVIDCLIEAPLNFNVVANYQGLAVRGHSVITNLASGGGPVYLYDLAEVDLPLPAGFTLIDKRPDDTQLGTGTVLRFDKNYEYAPISSGTFTVDLTGLLIGKQVVAYLGPATSAPSLAPLFQLVAGAYTAGVDLMYTFKVGANGKIQYVITQLP